MKSIALKLYVFLAMMFGGLLGIGGAGGLCAIVWGPSILHRSLNTTEPAFWVGLILLVPCLLFGLTAGFMVLGLPVAFRFPHIFEAMKIDQEDTRLATPLRWYAQHLLAYAERLEQRKRRGKRVDT